jgi:PAS domain S-box-containing protein
MTGKAGVECRGHADATVLLGRYEAVARAGRSIYYDSDRATGRVAYRGDTEAILGYSIAELDGEMARWIAHIHPDDRDAFVRAVERTDLASTAPHVEYRMIRKDGGIVWMRDEGHCTVGRDGSEPLRVIGFVREVTDQRRAEERFRLAADAINGIIYEYDFETGRVERSRGVHEVLGYRLDDVPPTADWWQQQVHPDDWPVGQWRAERIAADGSMSRTARS